MRSLPPPLVAGEAGPTEERGKKSRRCARSTTAISSASSSAIHVRAFSIVRTGELSRLRADSSARGVGAPATLPGGGAGCEHEALAPAGARVAGGDDLDSHGAVEHVGEPRQRGLGGGLEGGVDVDQEEQGAAMHCAMSLRSEAGRASALGTSMSTAFALARSRERKSRLLSPSFRWARRPTATRVLRPQ